MNFFILLNVFNGLVLSDQCSFTLFDYVFYSLYNYWYLIVGVPLIVVGCICFFISLFEYGKCK